VYEVVEGEEVEAEAVAGVEDEVEVEAEVEAEVILSEGAEVTEEEVVEDSAVVEEASDLTKLILTLALIKDSSALPNLTRLLLLERKPRTQYNNRVLDNLYYIFYAIAAKKYLNYVIV